MSDKIAYQKTALTGNTAASLDGIDGAILNDGDFAFVMAANILYVYLLDADSGATESSPDIIAPDTNPGDKRWILQPDTTISAYGKTLIDDATAADARTTLGLGTVATQAADAVAITGGTITGVSISPPLSGQNLLPNSGFSVWSQGSAAARGTAVAVSAYTTGSNTVICTTDNTQGLKLGKMITVTSGDASLQTCFHTITDLTVNTSFQFNLEGNSVAAGDGGAITVYEGVPYNSPGYATDYVCDGFGLNYWRKSATITQYRIDTEDVALGPPSFYCIQVIKGSASREAVYFKWLKADYPADVMKYAGRDMVFGAWVYTATADNVLITLSDGVTQTSSAYAVLGGWRWLEITQTMGAFNDISQIYIGVYLDGAIAVNSYIACPMLSLGTYLGTGNYAPIPNEVVHCLGHISPTHWTGATVAGSKVFRLEGETNGQIPKGAKALSLAFEGICDTVGDTLCVFRNAVADPLAHGIILGCAVATKVSYGGTSLVQITPGLENYIYITKVGTGAWTLCSFDINEVWL